MLRSWSLKRLKAYGVSGALPSVDASYADELSRHYGGIPGWRARDRNVLAAHGDAQAGAAPASGARTEEAIMNANAKVAAHEEAQIRAADDAVVRAAREGRMP